MRMLDRAEPAVQILSLSKSYQTLGSYFGNQSARVQAVSDISLKIRQGEAYGLVGESGSGKSTLARLILGLEKPTAGYISVMGKRIDRYGRKELRKFRKDVQIIYQDAYGALDPMMTIRRSIEEPLSNLTLLDKKARQTRIIRIFDDVELPLRLLDAYPHQLSGGERQRACIARAIVSNPRVVVCDEPVSSLDKSIQSQIVNLLKDLQVKHDLTYLFISHDIAVINQLCGQVAVMFQGQIVESGSRDEVIFNPKHPYTKSLMQAAEYFMEKLPPQLGRPE